MTTLAPRRTQGAAASQSEQRDTRFLLIVFAALVAGLWLVPLPSSLWLDEVGTYFYIKDGWQDTVERALWQVGHLPYYLVMRALRPLIGRSELLLRLPSVLTLLLATYLFHRLARRLMDAEGAMLTVIVFASLSAVGFAAADARPYGFALAALIGTTLVLLRWLETGRTRDGLLYAFLAALTVYIHVLFTAGLLVHAIYVTARHRSGTAPPLRTVWLPLALLFVFSAPAVVHVFSVLGRRDVYTFPVDLSVPALLRFFAPSVVAVGLLVGVMLARRLPGFSFAPRPMTRESAVLVISWLAVPPLALFVAARLGSTSVFVDRYVLSAAPGFALAAGWVLRSVSPAQARRMMAVAVVVVAMVTNGGRAHNQDDWRGAVEKANSLVTDAQTPVLLHTGFIEADRLDWLEDPEKADLLNAPASFYPVEGRPVAMPHDLTPEVRPYLDRVVADIVSSRSRFLLVTYCTCIPFEEWLSARLEPIGFSHRQVGQHGVVAVFAFEPSDNTTP